MILPVISMSRSSRCTMPRIQLNSTYVPFRASRVGARITEPSDSSGRPVLKKNALGILHPLQSQTTMSLSLLTRSTVSSRPVSSFPSPLPLLLNGSNGHGNESATALTAVSETTPQAISVTRERERGTVSPRCLKRYISTSANKVPWSDGTLVFSCVDASSNACAGRGITLIRKHPRSGSATNQRQQRRGGQGHPRIILKVRGEGRKELGGGTRRGRIVAVEKCSAGKRVHRAGQEGRQGWPVWDACGIAVFERPLPAQPYEERTPQNPGGGGSSLLNEPGPGAAARGDVDDAAMTQLSTRGKIINNN